MFRTPHILRPEYQLDLSPGYTVDITLGTGFDMSDPVNPRPRPLIFAEPASIPADVPPVNDLLNAQGFVFESTSEYREAHTIAVNFRGQASWGAGGVEASAAYTFAREQLESKHIFYAVFESAGTGARLQGNRQWLRPPDTDSIENEEERLKQFLLTYGSHYVTTVTFGQRLLVRFSQTKRSDSERRAFAAAVSAAAATMSASASLSETHLQELKTSETEVWATIVGDIRPSKFQYMTGWSDVANTMGALRDGTVTLVSGPIRCDLMTLFTELRAYPATRALLSEEFQVPPPAPYGVPKGTVVAWSPSSEHIGLDPGGTTRRLNVPDGWALCDGNGTPDLRDKFIMGTVNIDELNAHDAPLHAHSLLEARTTNAVPTGGAIQSSGYGISPSMWTAH
jgi:hypothetical protein